jgi:hypothetical protein
MIPVIKVENFSAQIYVGLHARDTSELFSVIAAEQICQEYCDTDGFCVTVTPTRYIYKDGWEQGVIVGLINYPRFPSTKEELKKRCFELATELMLRLKQKRVTIDFKDETVMLSNPELTNI